jgi:hypothetical protein
MSSSNQIPVNLDLEGGFAVGQSPQQAANTRRDSDDEYDHYYDAQHYNGALQDYDIYDDECDDDDYCQEGPEGYYYETPSNHDALEDSPQPQSIETSPSKQDLTTLGSTKPSTKPTAPRPVKTILGPPPTLLRTTTQVISSNLEKYHPHSFSIFSECQWESIVECRCESFAEVAASLHNASSTSKKDGCASVSSKV